MAYDENLAQRVREILKGVPMLVEKKMFGGIGFLLQGNMACGVHGENLIVRIDPQEYQAALAKPHVRPFDMTGRPMRGWIFVEPGGLKEQLELSRWVEQGLQFASGLPPK